MANLIFCQVNSEQARRPVSASRQGEGRQVVSCVPCLIVTGAWRVLKPPARSFSSLPLPSPPLEVQAAPPWAGLSCARTGWDRRGSHLWEFEVYIKRQSVHIPEDWFLLSSEIRLAETRFQWAYNLKMPVLKGSLAPVTQTSGPQHESKDAMPTEQQCLEAVAKSETPAVGPRTLISSVSC